MSRPTVPVWADSWKRETSEAIAMQTMMRTSCWCGATDLEPFCDGYARCTCCQTLVCTAAPHQAGVRVLNDQSDHYGADYWHGVQTKTYGLPDISDRARTDLPERCVYWLNQLTRLKLPPGRMLEVGSAHGGLVALSRLAGYDAAGLELSPSVCQFAETTFGIPMHIGPVEDQTFGSRSFDVIASMDVIEHLPDPVRTISTCAELLKDDGVLLIQTPRYPEGTSWEQMQEKELKFRTHLQPGEHLNLFSRTSVELLMRRCGFEHVQFFPAIFDFYDMFFAASRMPIMIADDDARTECLARPPDGRIALAMLDAEDRFRDLLAKHRAALKELREPRSEPACA
jgi:SAM-dependent methyltransferase